VPAAKAAGPKPFWKAPLIPRGAIVLQVAALTRDTDALALAEALQEKEYPAFVLTPSADNLYRVQVGPYADAKSAEIAKRSLEREGFKTITKR
jgi:cell division septation protein DedD